MFLTLLDRAAAAGLDVAIVGDRLMVRGPRSASDLIAEVGRHKAEVMAALRDRDASPPDSGDAYEGDLPPGPTLLVDGCEEYPVGETRDQATAEPLPWEELATQRWGPAIDEPEPGIDVPANDWRWEVANWPPDRWLAWHRRAGELEPPGADAGAIRAAQLFAYEELLGGRAPATAGEVPAAAPQAARCGPVAPIEDDAPATPRPAAPDGWGDDPPAIEGFELLADEDLPAFAFDPSLTITVEAAHASIEHDRATREAMARMPQMTKRAGRVAARPDQRRIIDDHRDTIGGQAS